jgi:riboflavin kinase/FMN adenylyltransferase
MTSERRGSATTGNEAPQIGWPTRAFVLKGTVEHGDQRGRQLGFPTANLALRREPGTLPEGVYAGMATTVDGRCFGAAVSVGRRPTFYADGFELLEAHLLDFSEDIYDQEVEVRVYERMRGQVRFDSVEALIRQLNADVENVRQLVDRRLLES